MKTSMDLLFSSLLFAGDYSGLLSSSVLVFPLVTIAPQTEGGEGEAAPI
jgi:hypothetical protein